MADHSRYNDLGIDEPSGYALVIDSRTPREYEDDHLPEAVNLPIVDNDEFAEVGTTYVTDRHAAYLTGAAYASKNMATHLRTIVSRFGQGDRILVYCFRGGKRSRAWADTLRNIGFAVDVLPGGWKAYRRWVLQQLDSLPKLFDYRTVAGLTGCGKTRLLQALGRAGCQVLDLEELASHRGSLLGELPGRPQPPQKLFDTRLLHRLRAFRVDRPVWVESESKKVGNLQLPEALFDRLSRARTVEISAPIDARVQLLLEDYAHLAREPVKMVDHLEPLKPLVGGEELAHWRSLAEAGQAAQLFERVLFAHYDPCYVRARRRSADRGVTSERLELAALDDAALSQAAAGLAARFDAVAA